MRPALQPKVLFISSIVCVIILIVTQYKIEMFKKSVDVKSNFDQLDENENNQESNSTNYNRNTVCIVICLILCSFLVLVYIVIFVRGKSIILEHIHWLIFICTLNFINIIVIPVIFIVRNENLYHFSQRQIIKIFQCCRKWIWPWLFNVHYLYVLFVYKNELKNENKKIYMYLCYLPICYTNIGINKCILLLYQLAMTESFHSTTNNIFKMPKCTRCFTMYISSVFSWRSKNE